MKRCRQLHVDLRDQVGSETAELRERYERAYAALGGDPKVTVTEGTKEERKAERKRLITALSKLPPADNTPER